MQFPMMQMSHARMKKQSLFMMMPVHVFKPRCKCILAEMEMQKSCDANAPSGYVMMQMSSYGYAMMQMFPCRYENANVPLGVCHDADVFLWVCHDANASL